MTHQLGRFSITAMEDEAVLFMQLRLVPLGEHEVIGIYEGKLPARMRYLRPKAAASYREHLSERVVLSDMFRSPEASLRAKKTRKGSQRPAYSGHNYGTSIDADVTATMKNIGAKNKRQMDDWMAERGWYCHRRDHQRRFEEWHYNYFGELYDELVRKSDSRTSPGLERWITKSYGAWWIKQTATDSQRMLTRLGMYDGDLDGEIGPLSKEAVRVFQRGWAIKESGDLTVMTRRALAYVSADRIAA